MKRIPYIFSAFFLLAFLTGCGSGNALGLNEQASVQMMDELPENPLLLHAITGSIQPKDSTMATLYGNDTAFTYARNHTDNNYPSGSVLYQVTWQQQADKQWIGANIPKQILSVERLAYTADGNPAYTIYKGSPLKQTSEPDTALRVRLISGQRVAASP